MTTATDKTLDVRPLLARGEEPFALLRAEADRLAPGRRLTVIAPFLPAPLVELLKSEGFAVAISRRGDGAWAVEFRRE